MTTQWYALHSKPLKEALLGEQLGLHQIETYCPQIRVRPANPRARKVRAYFPGYLFVRVSAEEINLRLLRRMPGSTGMVSCDGMPSPIPENLIVAIRRRVDELNAEGGERLAGLKRGDFVTIQEGSFRGYEAIFDAHLSDAERVRVLLKLLSKRQFPLEIPVNQIQRKKQ
jgi:transcriptional antiterminator RfaH